MNHALLHTHIAAQAATTKAVGTLLMLNRAHRIYPGTGQRVQQEVVALGAALRQLEQTTPTLLFRPVPVVAPLVCVAPVVRFRPAITPIRRVGRDPALVQQTINGSKALLLEILRRAAYDWVLYRESSKLQSKKLAEEAFIWLFQEGAGHPDWVQRALERKEITSFLAICEALDLDPKAVRTRIRELTTKHVMSVGRPAEYRRHDTSRLEENSVSAVNIEEHNFEHVSLEELDGQY